LRCGSASVEGEQRRNAWHLTVLRDLF